MVTPLPKEEANTFSDLILELFTEDEYSVDEKEAKLLSALTINSDKPLRFVECSNCYDWFEITVYQCCPSCMREYEIFVSGDVVALPPPLAANTWKPGQHGIVTGSEVIGGNMYCIVTCEDGRSWCVLQEDLID